MDLANFSQMGVGVAALAALIYVVRSVRGIAKDNQTFLGNHMSSNTKAMQDVAVTLSALTQNVNDFKDQNKGDMKQLHTDNLTLARETRANAKRVAEELKVSDATRGARGERVATTLESADKNVTRKVSDQSKKEA